MRIRFAIIIGASASLVLAWPSAAAPRKTPPPVCMQILDKKGDATIVTAQPGLDVVSADIASDGQSVTAVIRLADKPEALNLVPRNSSRYYFEFTSPSATNPLYLSAAVSWGPVVSSLFRGGEVTSVADGGLGAPTPDGRTAYRNYAASNDVIGSINGSTITITARGTALTPGLGAEVTQLKVKTFALEGVVLVHGDDAETAKSYRGGVRTCAKSL